MIDIRTVLHPRTGTLVRFAADDPKLGEPTRRRVRQHLETCPECRGVVVRSREVAAAAAALPTPTFDRVAAWERLQARAAAGDRSLLATDDAPARRGPRLTRALAAAAAGIIVLVWTAMPGSRRLEAGVGQGDLVVDSAAVQPGREVPVRYTPSSTLAGADSVILVATFFGEQPRTRPFEERHVMHRAGDNGFQGRLPMPEHALVARLHVVSPDGARSDDNYGRRWEIVARDVAGRPRFDALYAQYAIRDRSEWEQEYRIVQQMILHHPDEPKGWRFHAGKSFDLAGRGARDSVRSVFRPELERLHEHYRARAASSELSWEMAMFASALDDTVKSRFWRQRLQQEHPTSPGAAQFRVWDISESEPDRRRRIAAFDRLYDEVGGGSLQLLYDAFDTAVRLGDSASVARWGDRMIDGRPENRIFVVAEFIRIPALREEGLRRARALLQEHPPVTTTDWVTAYGGGTAMTQAQRQTQVLLAQIATGLTGRGETRAALDTLRRAASLGRHARLTRQLADVALAAGDTAEAARAWAWLSADPRTSPASIDSAASRLGTRMQSTAFAAWKSAAAHALTEEVLATARRRTLGEEVRLRGPDGRMIALEAHQGRELTVVAFISRYCAPSLDDLPALDATAKRLEAAGIPMLAVIAEEPTDAVRATYAKRGWTGPLYYDRDGTAMRAFRQEGSPAYYVVTADNSVPFLARRGEELLLQTAALTR